MKLLRKSKLNFLFFSVIFLFLSSCSVESNLPDKISKDISDPQEIAPPPKQEQPSWPSNPGQNPSNPGINTETQIDKDRTQEEKRIRALVKNLIRHPLL